jgi:hypothetical protein
LGKQHSKANQASNSQPADFAANSKGSSPRRPIPANKVSSNRIIMNRAARSSKDSIAKFEFGTVMMFPAGDGRRITDSSIYRPPRRNSAVQFGSPLEPTEADGFASQRKPGSGLGSESLAANSNNRPSLAQNSPLKNGIGDSTLATKIIGPERLLVNTPNKFEIVVANTSARPATNIIVQLTAPDGITISKLDRSAWLDETNRTVSWRIAELPGGYRTSIRYQAVSLTPGRHRQQITVGMDNVFQGEMIFDTFVAIPQENGTFPQGNETFPQENGTSTDANLNQ